SPSEQPHRPPPRGSPGRVRSERSQRLRADAGACHEGIRRRARGHRRGSREAPRPAWGGPGARLLARAQGAEANESEEADRGEKEGSLSEAKGRACQEGSARAQEKSSAGEEGDAQGKPQEEALALTVRPPDEPSPGALVGRAMARDGSV